MTLGAGLVNTCWLHVLLRLAGVPGSACDHQLRAKTEFISCALCVPFDIAGLWDHFMVSGLTRLLPNKKSLLKASRKRSWIGIVVCSASV